MKSLQQHVLWANTSAPEGSKTRLVHLSAELPLSCPGITGPNIASRVPEFLCLALMILYKRNYSFSGSKRTNHHKQRVFITLCGLFQITGQEREGSYEISWK